MTTVGLDLSLTHTGYAIIREGGVVLGSGVIKSKPVGDRPVDELRRIVSIVDEALEHIFLTVEPREDVDLVAIEGLAFMAQGTSLVQLAGLNYMVRAHLDKLDIKFLIVAPTTLKKFVTGSGKGDKDLMMMSVFKNYGFESMDNNECDAYALAVCGMAVLGKPIKPLLKPQQEVVKLLIPQL